MRFGVSRLDRAISRAARRHPARKPARLLAALCSPWAATVQGVATAAALRASGRPSGGVALAPFAAVTVAKLLKRATHRPRPGWKRFRRNGWRSFPSSHVAGPVALLTALWVGSPPRARAAIAVALGGVLLAVGVERLRDGAHWPSDVVAGGALGVLVGGALGRRTA